MRPKSIDQFSYVYGALILLGLLSTWLSWEALLAQVSVQQMIARFGETPLYVSAGIGVLIQVLLWYFIVYRGSVIAKWIFVVLNGASAAWGAFGLVSGGGFTTVLGMIGILSIVLQVAAIWLLFRPDTPEWFGEVGEDAA